MNPIARDVGVEQRGSPPARRALAELDRGDVPGAGPAVDGDHAIPCIDCDDHAPAVGATRILDELRRAHGRGAEHDERRAGRDHPVDRSAIADPAADLDRQRRRFDDRTDQRLLLWCAGERTVEIDDVQAIRTAVDERCHELDRALGEHGRALAPAFFEPHRAAVEEIDRGIQLHAASTKRRSIASPTAWLFSG